MEKGERLDRILIFVVDKLFSGLTLGLLFLIGFIYCMFLVFSFDMERTKKYQQTANSCYEQGMVVVSTDAGVRCVDPRSLVKPK